MDPEFIFTRVFDAPRALVWEAFTKADHLSHWWGPKGVSIDVKTLEVRPGGEFHYAMKSTYGTMWGKFVYREIQPPEKIIFLNSFSDEAGNITRAPFNQDWPLEVSNTWTFEEKSGKTTLTGRGIPHKATEAEKAVFKAGFNSMTQGFGGTMDQLELYLKKIA